MDGSTVGARLRILRRWRGMTQAEVAGLAGLSPSFLSMVESGQRPLDRRSHVAAVASALRISETDLVGGPHLSADREQADPHMAIPALWEALHTNKLSCPAVERARPLPELVAEVAERIGPLRADSDYAKAGSLLPDVLDELHWHTATATDEASRRLALETLIEACITAGLSAGLLPPADVCCRYAVRAWRRRVPRPGPGVAAGPGDPLSGSYF